MVATYILGLALLLAPVFAEYADLKKKAEKGFAWIAGGGILFLLAAAFKVGFWSQLSAQVATSGSMLFELIGWIFVLIGVIWAAFKLVS